MTNQNAGAEQAAATRRPYSTPSLTVHGALADITMGGMGTGGNLPGTPPPMSNNGLLGSR